MKVAYLLLSLVAVAQAAPLVAPPAAGSNELAARSDDLTSRQLPGLIPDLPLDDINTLLQNALKNIKGITNDAITDVQRLIDSLLTGGLPDLGALFRILTLPPDQIKAILETVIATLPGAPGLAGLQPLISGVIALLERLLGSDGLAGTIGNAGGVQGRALPDVSSQLEGALGALKLPAALLKQVIDIVTKLLGQLLGGLVGGLIPGLGRKGGVTIQNFPQKLTSELKGLGLDENIIGTILGTVNGLLGGLLTQLLGGLIGGLPGGIVGPLIPQ